MFIISGKAGLRLPLAMLASGVMCLLWLVFNPAPSQLVRLADASFHLQTNPPSIGFSGWHDLFVVLPLFVGLLALSRLLHYVLNFGLYRVNSGGFYALLLVVSSATWMLVGFRGRVNASAIDDIVMNRRFQEVTQHQRSFLQIPQLVPHLLTNLISDKGIESGIWILD